MTAAIEDKEKTGLGEFEDLPEGDGVIIFSPKGEVMSANLQMERIFKHKIETGRRYGLKEFFTPQYLPQAELSAREAVQGGHSRSNLKAEIKTGSGSSVPVEYSVFPLFTPEGRIIGVTFSFFEVLPWPKYSRSGRLTGGIDYDALVENLAEGVFTINHRWRITSFNKRAQEITGFEQYEVLGRYCWDIFQSDLCRSGCPMRTTMETGVVRMDQDVRIVGKRGHKMTILVNANVIKDKKDNIIGAVETFRPVNLMDSNHEKSEAKFRPPEIIGVSTVLTDLLDKLPDVARSEASVVIEGESGTGKELVARAIHTKSLKAQGPFVAVNTSALAETLLESELFGHEKAAFTGAISSKVGRFELARGGTLFLDEVAEIKPEIQIKLLRVLEEHKFERVGGTRSIVMDARIICATNRNIIKEVREGRFREDLFYRLRTVPLYLPPLRERYEDVPLLVEHFVQKLNIQYKKNVRTVDPKVMSLFQRYHWPGNIRELYRVLEYAFVFVKGPAITASHLPEMEEGPKSRRRQAYPNLWEDERQAVLKALDKASGKRQEAARLLGISRSSLWRKMKAHGLS